MTVSGSKILRRFRRALEEGDVVAGVVRVARRARSRLRAPSESAIDETYRSFRDASVLNAGVLLRVGADVGEELVVYQELGKSVVWIDALSEPLRVVREKVGGDPRHVTIEALLADVLEAGPTAATTYASLHRRNGLARFDIDYLVLHVRRSQLAVLRGMEEHLQALKFIETRSPADGAPYDEVAAFLESRGFARMLSLEAGALSGVRYWDNVRVPKYYSQLGQDRWIADEVYPGKTSGFFVEVGAYDGVALSNTCALERYRGWDGLCIEPGRAVERLRESRRCRVSDAFVGGKSGSWTVFNDQELFGGRQTQVREWGRGARRIRRTVALGEVLERHRCPRRIDYLSLDTEGSECEILQSFPFARYEIGAITVEHNFEKEKRAALRALLVSKGFVLAREQRWDDWYVRRDGKSPSAS